jgi:hypothetical protein
LIADADGNVREIFWTYDAVGRLTDEAITHFDSSISQSEKFTYDLTGNRTKLERDHDGVAGIDEAITYNYDVNDRLLTELFDDKTSANADTATTYGYDHTQQTSKIVTDERRGASLRLSAQSFTYSLQGLIDTVINDGYTSGNLSSSERTSYDYNFGSYRCCASTHFVVLCSSSRHFGGDAAVGGTVWGFGIGGSSSCSDFEVSFQ